MNEMTNNEEDARAYRYLADAVIKWFNPPDGEEAEEAICADSIKAAGKFIESLPCACEDGAGYPDYHVDPCRRCQVLGRAADEGVER